MFTFVTSAAEGESVYFDVFTVDGKRIAKGVKSLDGIARGFYIVNGKKVFASKAPPNPPRRGGLS